jgi:hypothetical protein
MEDDNKKDTVDSNDVVPYVLANYERATEYGIADAERQLRAVNPFSPDRGLLYALRISVCLPRIRKLDTLASRYNTAENRGLLRSRESPYYQKVYDFLTDKYLCRFVELADEVYQEAQKTAGQRVTKEAKVKVLYDTQEKIFNSMQLFEHVFVSLEGATDSFLKQISEDIANIQHSPMTMKPNQRNISIYKANADIVKGYTLSVAMQLRTPLKYLEMLGQIFDLEADPPQIPIEYGCWIPQCKSWAELGIDIKEWTEGTMASDIGPIPASGGQYLEFLKAFRTIVESTMSPEQMKDAILSLGTDNSYFASILSTHPNLQGDKLNQWLGYDEILGISGFNPTLAKALYEAGFRTAEGVKSASDKELCSVKGIGQAKVKEIRELQNQVTK